VGPGGGFSSGDLSTSSIDLNWQAAPCAGYPCPQISLAGVAAGDQLVVNQTRNSDGSSTLFALTPGSSTCVTFCEAAATVPNTTLVAFDFSGTVFSSTFETSIFSNQYFFVLPSPSAPSGPAMILGGALAAPDVRTVPALELLSAWPEIAMDAMRRGLVDAGVNCNPNPVARGEVVTCSPTLPSGQSPAHVRKWTFDDGLGGTVTHTPQSSSETEWKGKAVQSGTVTAYISNATQSPATAPGTKPATFKKSGPLTVNNRSGFEFPAVTPTRESNSFSSPTCGVMSVPSPPQPDKELGLFCLQQPYSFTFQQINDGGPNQGYRYITSVSNSLAGTSTAYYYVVSPDSADPGSEFSRAQYGNYDKNTNPGGFISQANLIKNIIRHESGNANSHYAQYVAGQNDPANNLGTVGEQIVGLLSDTDFKKQVDNILSAKRTLIGSRALHPEPCSANYDGSITPCVFQGYVNYIPYVPLN
jgi:hypothetical protein